LFALYAYLNGLKYKILNVIFFMCPDRFFIMYILSYNIYYLSMRITPCEQRTSVRLLE